MSLYTACLSSIAVSINLGLYLPDSKWFSEREWNSFQSDGIDWHKLLNFTQKVLGGLQGYLFVPININASVVRVHSQCKTFIPFASAMNCLPLPLDFIRFDSYRNGKARAKQASSSPSVALALATVSSD